MKKNIGIGLLIVVLIGIIAYLSLKPASGNIVWVNVQKVYDEFDYKKELEAKLLKTQEARKAIIDSSEFELKVLSREIKMANGKDKNKISLFETKRARYYETKEAFENDNANMQKQYNEQILTQINQYMKDFGLKKKYKYILGAKGDGDLMYAEDGEDITVEAILFINEKYKGKIE